MKSLNESIHEYGKQVEKGEIKEAYQGLIDYIRGLRIFLKNKHPEYGVSGNIHQGNMDVTFFTLSPKFLKDRDLKIEIVFIHEETQFEIWLSGKNAYIQKKDRDFLRNCNLNKYTISDDENESSSIIECSLEDNPNFDSETELTNKIENGVKKFIEDIEDLIEEKCKIPKEENVEAFLEEMMTADDEKSIILQELRRIVFENFEKMNERMMYGGIMFSAEEEWGGVFVTEEHISFEFIDGFKIDDPDGLLEGTGEIKRYLKIECHSDIVDKRVDYFVKQAIDISNL